MNKIGVIMTFNNDQDKLKYRYKNLLFDLDFTID